MPWQGLPDSNAKPFYVGAAQLQQALQVPLRPERPPPAFLLHGAEELVVYCAGMQVKEFAPAVDGALVDAPPKAAVVRVVHGQGEVKYR